MLCRPGGAAFTKNNKAREIGRDVRFGPEADIGVASFEVHQHSMDWSGWGRTRPVRFAPEADIGGGEK